MVNRVAITAYIKLLHNWDQILLLEIFQIFPLPEEYLLDFVSYYNLYNRAEWLRFTDVEIDWLTIVVWF